MSALGGEARVSACPLPPWKIKINVIKWFLFSPNGGVFSPTNGLQLK